MARLPSPCNGRGPGHGVLLGNSLTVDTGHGLQRRHSLRTPKTSVKEKRDLGQVKNSSADQLINDSTCDPIYLDLLHKNILGFQFNSYSIGRSTRVGTVDRVISRIFNAQRSGRKNLNIEIRELRIFKVFWFLNLKLDSLFLHCFLLIG